MGSQYSKKLFAASIIVIVTIVGLIAGVYLLHNSMQTGKGAVAWVTSFDFQRDPASYDSITIRVKNLGSKPAVICFAIFDVTGNLWRSALMGEGSAAWTMTGCSDSGGSNPWQTNGAVGSLQVWTIRFQPILPATSTQYPWLGQGSVIVYSKDSVTLIAATGVMIVIGRSRTAILQWLPAEYISIIISTILRPLLATIMTSRED